MREKRQRERSKATPPPLTYQAEDILIAKNRNLSPLVLSFIYEPENIALKDLGTLFGTFIVADHHEDSGYIVNCLAAAAKKEYYINSRRSVEESFESTLHKINLTLGKLVRDGHINWMGKLHGSIIAIHDRETYFSVTGNGTILLLRNAALSAISDGLADPEAALHPLKTFTDIAEGSLLPSDKIIVSTPELLELLPHALLEREAGKLPLDRFAQLLKTALINERSAAATILIDFSEAPTEGTRSALRIGMADNETETSLTQPFIENIFSNQTFQKHSPEKDLSEEKLPPQQNDSLPGNTGTREHIDNRTGHIYIQADSIASTSETETALDRGLVIFKEQGFIFFIKIKKISRKNLTIGTAQIQHISSRSLEICIRTSRTMGGFVKKYSLRLFQEIVTIVARLFSRTATLQNISFPKKNETAPIDVHTNLPEQKSSAALSFFSPTKTSPAKGVSYAWSYDSLERSLQSFRASAIRFAQKTITLLPPFWQQRKKWEKNAFFCTALLIIIGIGIHFLPSSPSPAPKETLTIDMPIAPPSTFPPIDEPLSQKISGQSVFSINESETPLHPILLREKLFVLTKSTLVNTDGQTTLSLPSAILPIRAITAMNDLNAIFLYGEDANLYIYYPNAKSLVKNTFPLPNDFVLSDMGTYLTYLYVLDAPHGKILRFPRAEGGFGAPTDWLKENITFDEHAKMSIGENILITSNNTVFSFTKGHGAALPSPQTAASITMSDNALAGDGSLGILDTKAKRILRIGNTGTLLHQFFSEPLNDAHDLILSSDGITAMLAIKGTVLSFDLRQ